MQKRTIWIAIFLMALATTALADWSRDITYQTAEPSGTYAYLGVQGIHDGPVVADVIPSTVLGWEGKEILQATRTSILILSADNQQTPLELAIPDPATYFHVDCQFSADGDEFIASQPAVGDVDNDGDNDIVVGLTFKCERELPNDEWLLDYYGSVVWWTWNANEEHFDDPHFMRLESPLTHAFLGTPAICRTGWSDGGTTVVFWGPSSLQVTPFRHSWYVLTAFDLSDPQQPQAIQATSGLESATEAQTTWALSSGIYVQAADLNGDGYDELIAHTDWKVMRFDWSGSVFFGTDRPTVLDGNAFQSGHAAIADVDADGDLEYLVSYSTLATPPTNGRLVQIDISDNDPPDLPIFYGDAEQNIYPIVGSQPGVCDLSRHPSSPPETPEGRLSPITSTRGDSRMYNSATGDLRSGAWPIFQLYYPDDQRNVSNPALAYVTGTPLQPQLIKVDIGYPNVGDSEIRVYDAITGDLVYSANPVVPSIYVDPDGYSAVTSSPTYGDLDGNGQGSFITSFRTSETQLYLFRTDPGYAFNPELAEWSQIEGGPDHKGLYAQPVSSGILPLTSTVWSGRMTLYGTCLVNTGQTLTIEPGTVVEFKPGAKLRVYGTLVARGTPTDSIYFKADGTTKWHGIDLYGPQRSATLDYCVIHGCSTGVFVNYVNPGLINQISHSRIYDVVNAGIDAYTVPNTGALVCTENDISGALYGIRGVTSSGNFSNNSIHNCLRAGIYWYGDAGQAVPAKFHGNEITSNGIGGSALAGGYFTSTTARLSCNNFFGNANVQLHCEYHGDVVMNNEFGPQGAINRFEILGYPHLEPCPTCDANCNCSGYPPGYFPLVWLSKSDPHFKYGHNAFIVGPWFASEGTFIFNKSNLCPTEQGIGLEESFYFVNNGIGLPPSPDNEHFCPTTGYEDSNPLTQFPTCGGAGATGLTGASLAYKTAADAERNGQVTSANDLFREVIEEYPLAEEALWATRGYLRTGLASEIPYTEQHDSLHALWQDESQSMTVREAARREAIWALIAGEDFGTARTELEAITAEEANEDSLWAVVTLELVTLLENGGPGIQSIGNEQAMQTKVAAFHERLHQLMGRPTDEELRAQATVPASHQLATAYPNPFNSTVTLQFELPEAGQASLEIFNLLGQKVATVLNETLPAGTHTRQWKADDVPSGVYFYRFRTGGHLETHKLLLLK